MKRGKGGSVKEPQSKNQGCREAQTFFKKGILEAGMAGPSFAKMKR